MRATLSRSLPLPRCRGSSARGRGVICDSIPGRRSWCCGGCSTEEFESGCAIISCFTALVSAAACQIRNVNRNFDFQDIHSIARIGKFLREGGDIFRLEVGKFQALIGVAIIVSQGLQEERPVKRGTLSS